MRSGRLDRTVDIQSKTTTQTSSGQPVDSWSTVATVAAHVVPTRGDERFTAEQVVGKAVQTFRIRYRSGVTVLNRLVYNGRNWDIHDVREIGRREGLEIDATARSE